MDTQMSEEDMRRTAVRRARAKIGFQQHALIYGLVNAGLAVINFTTSPGHLWFIYPLGGWGIGLLSHGLAVYGFGGGRHEAMVEREMETLRRQSGRS